MLKALIGSLKERFFVGDSSSKRLAMTCLPSGDFFLIIFSLFKMMGVCPTVDSPNELFSILRRVGFLIG